MESRLGTRTKFILVKKLLMHLETFLEQKVFSRARQQAVADAGPDGESKFEVSMKLLLKVRKLRVGKVTVACLNSP